MASAQVGTVAVLGVRSHTSPVALSSTASPPKTSWNRSLPGGSLQAPGAKTTENARPRLQGPKPSAFHVRTHQMPAPDANPVVTVAEQVAESPGQAWAAGYHSANRGDAVASLTWT